MASNLHRQLRVADTTSDDSFGNFALSAQRNFKICDWDISVGAGYLNSTIYDMWVEAKRDHWSFMAEYTKAERAWPATGRAVEALTLQVAYDTELWC